MMKEFLLTQLRTIFNIQVPVHYSMMVPARQHQQSSLSYCAQCSTGLYYAIDLCPYNEKTRWYSSLSHVAGSRQGKGEEIDLYIYIYILAFAQERNVIKPSLCMMDFKIANINVIWLLPNTQVKRYLFHNHCGENIFFGSNMPSIRQWKVTLWLKIHIVWTSICISERCK